MNKESSNVQMFVTCAEAKALLELVGDTIRGLEERTARDGATWADVGELRSVVAELREASDRLPREGT